MSSPVFHRFASDYLSTEEWGDLLRADSRVARVLGTEPLPDARHLLANVGDAMDRPSTESEDNVSPADFVVRLTPTIPRTAQDLFAYFSTAVRASLDFPRIVVQVPSRTGDGERDVPLDELSDNARIRSLTLVWSLPDLLTIGNKQELTSDLRRFIVASGEIGVALGMTATAVRDPASAAHDAVTLRALLRKSNRQSELRLVPPSGSFASRNVWRAAYSLGLEWGTLDLFHWKGGTNTSQFRILSAGNPPYFFPERAVEGERVPGLILEFDLPRAADPLAIFDRMAIALAYLQSTLGGYPRTKSGRDLDAEQLDAERDSLEAAVQAMTNAGIAPGSPTALRFF